MPLAIAAILLLLQSVWLTSLAQTAPPAAPSAASSADSQKQEPTPEEKMSRRFPQPVRVGDLIGLPVLDDRDSTIGHVSEVVRTSGGKIQIVVPYGPWFGWVRLGGPFAWSRRPIGVPIETVVILGRQIDSVDMPREAFDAAPTLVMSGTRQMGREEVVRIGLGRR